MRAPRVPPCCSVGPLEQTQQRRRRRCRAMRSRLSGWLRRRARHQECETAAARVAAAATRLDFMPSDGRHVRAAGGRSTPAQPLRVTGSTELELEGFGRMIVTPGGEDLDARQQALSVGRSSVGRCAGGDRRARASPRPRPPSIDGARPRASCARCEAEIKAVLQANAARSLEALAQLGPTGQPSSTGYSRSASAWIVGCSATRRALAGASRCRRDRSARAQEALQAARVGRARGQIAGWPRPTAAAADIARRAAGGRRAAGRAAGSRWRLSVRDIATRRWRPQRIAGHGAAARRRADQRAPGRELRAGDADGLRERLDHRRARARRAGSRAASA